MRLVTDPVRRLYFSILLCSGKNIGTEQKKKGPHLLSEYPIQAFLFSIISYFYYNLYYKVLGDF